MKAGKTMWNDIVKANCARANATGSKPLTTPPYLPPPVAPLSPGEGPAQRAVSQI